MLLKKKSFFLNKIPYHYFFHYFVSFLGIKCRKLELRSRLPILGSWLSRLFIWELSHFYELPVPIFFSSSTSRSMAQAPPQFVRASSWPGISTLADSLGKLKPLMALAVRLASLGFFYLKTCS